MPVEMTIARYHGGKWKLAKWIISYFPEHRVYVEPFGGAGSVLLQKPRCYAEVYNDLDNEIVNLFKMVRDQGSELKRLLELTPFARKEFLLSYEPSSDPLEQARRTVIRASMGFGSNSLNALTGFRSNCTRSGTTPAHDFANYPEYLEEITKRLRGIVIENRNYLEVLTAYDGEETLFYVDPPYVLSTRDNRKRYKCEMTDQEHTELANSLKLLKGFVVVSGYNCDLYRELYSDWIRVDKETHADGARKRVESLWLNHKTASHQKQINLL